MLFQPAIIALILASAVSTLMLASSLPFVVRVLRRWDMASGAETQLEMERRTYLVATLLKLVLVAQGAALVLFVFNADRMASLFTGAMCAVGTLKVDRWGFPALYLHMAVFFLSAFWLVLNHVDNLGWDYPLIRLKYAALLGLAPVVAVAGGVQLAYFLGLRADVITSCCSTLFSGNGITVTSNALAAMPHGVALGLLAAGLAAVAASGAHFLLRGSGGVVHALASAAVLGIGLAAVVSTISVYVYELPHHHCPFCLLKREYGHVGYALYLPLFLGTVCGVGGGIAARTRRHPSLALAAPRAARRLVGVSLACFAAFGVVALWLVLRSHLILFEAAP
ncbi:hypothetical protein [Magnetospirillum sp. UT-4]|uniref:hypothetical protein n=1 Tax=Magnetospirillum sp. UT-4 TaxID=2681467 RepID=UPI0013835031|nr:hypothetical protein [Magnetospirillum sp. UT-4]CAA7622779.1 conserved membrane hypothetical protein [Magnetospirillum sp. UT-4]